MKPTHVLTAPGSAERCWDRHLTLAVVATAAGYGVLLPLLPGLLEAAGTADVARHTGLLMGAYGLAGALASPLWGWLCDRRDPLAVLRAGLVGQTLAMLMAVLSPALPLLYASRLLQGALAAGVVPAALVLGSRLAVGEAGRAWMFARLSRGALLGGLLGPAIGGLFAGERGLLAPVLIAGGLAAAAVLALAALPGTNARHHRLAAQAPAVQLGPLTLLLALGALAALTMSVFEVGIATRARAYGLDAYRLGTMFAGCGSLMLLAQAVVFRRHHDPRRVWRLVAPGFVVSGAGLLALTGMESGALRMAGVVAVALGGGVLQPATAYWTAQAAGAGEGLALGMRQAVSTAAQAVGALVGAYALDPAYRPLLLGLLAIVGAAAVACAALGRRWPMLRLRPRGP